MRLMSKAQRACQIWSLLSWVAYSNQLITYKQVSQLIGVPLPALGQLLEPIQSFCIKHQLPPLTIIVVSEKTGIPGNGFTAASSVPQYQQEVFRFQWLDYGNPNPEMLDEAVKEIPSNGTNATK